MKPLILLAFFCACPHAKADELRLDELGLPFASKSLKILWQAPTNRIPNALSVYRVVPARFSSQTISNLVFLGAFNNPEMARNALVPALKGKDALFEEVPAHVAINISPSRGLADFFNNTAMPFSRKPDYSPPSDDEVLQAGLRIATLLQIKPAELARRPKTHEYVIVREKQTQDGKVNGKFTEWDITRGIRFYRAVDGISFEGTGFCGGLYVNFGKDSKIANLDLSWRKLEAQEKRPTVDTNELTNRIRRGRAVIQIEEGNPLEFQKLTVTNAVPHYRGYASSEPQSWVYPFVIIEGTAQFNAQEYPVSFSCPILKD